MSSENANQPAYPTEAGMGNSITDGYHQNGNTTALFHGLSKREYFAGLAMQGLLSNQLYVERLESNTAIEDKNKMLCMESVDMAFKMSFPTSNNLIK